MITQNMSDVKDIFAQEELLKEKKKQILKLLKDEQTKKELELKQQIKEYKAILFTLDANSHHDDTHHGEVSATTDNADLHIPPDIRNKIVTSVINRLHETIK